MISLEVGGASEVAAGRGWGGGFSTGVRWVGGVSMLAGGWVLVGGASVAVSDRGWTDVGPSSDFTGGGSCAEAGGTICVSGVFVGGGEDCDVPGRVEEGGHGFADARASSAEVTALTEDSGSGVTVVCN